MAVRKIGLMHQLFGVASGRCGDCFHFVQGQYRSKVLRKCEVYGFTHSEASDWAKRWTACGLFNQETQSENIIRLVRRANQTNDFPSELDGQMEMEAK